MPPGSTPRSPRARPRAARAAPASPRRSAPVPSRSRISAANASSWSATRRAARSPAPVRRTRAARASCGSGSRATRPSFSSRSRLRVSVLGADPESLGQRAEPQRLARQRLERRRLRDRHPAARDVGPLREREAPDERRDQHAQLLHRRASFGTCLQGLHICNIQLASRMSMQEGGRPGAARQPAAQPAAQPA